MLYQYDTTILPQVRFIGFIEYTTPWQHFERQIDEYILYIVKKGNLYIEEDGKQYALKEGDMLLLDPMKIHKGYKACDSLYYFFHFSHKGITIPTSSYDETLQTMLVRRNNAITSNLYDFFEDENIYNYIPKYFNISNQMVLNRLFKDINIATDDFYNNIEDSKHIASSCLYETFIKISQEYLSSHLALARSSIPKNMKLVENIIEYIHRNYSRKITSEDIDSITELNYNYFNRLFQKATGYTVTNYMNRIRVNKSIELLRTTNLNIAEVAYLVGINDPYYFSKLFKKNTGIPPSNFRTTLIKNEHVKEDDF